MVQNPRLFSGTAFSRGGRPLGAGLIFVVGLLAGIAVGPINARTGSSADTGPRAAPKPQGHIPFAMRGYHPAEVLRVIDGDTFEARVHIWPGTDITTRVRLREIDAPEFKARCMEERNKAEAARDRLKALLDEGEVVITHVGLDKYGGRVLAAASTRRTPDVSSALLQAGLVRGYDGGRRDGWCP
jgi:endonuclease YncB( thermonuclease family)